MLMNFIILLKEKFMNLRYKNICIIKFLIIKRIFSFIFVIAQIMRKLKIFLLGHDIHIVIFDNAKVVILMKC